MEPVVAVVEDDQEIRAILAEGLRKEGFDVTAAATGAAFLERLEQIHADALVIDIGLPDADGRDLCQALRAAGNTTPVLFLTALDALPDRLAGLRAGGDDYLAKPFALAEVAERLRALLRRSGGDGRPLETVGLRLDPARHAVSAGAASVSLTPTEFRLLATLLATPGAVVRRRALKQAGWPHGAIVHDNMLDAFLARLRRKLRQLPEPPTLTTQLGVGYKIEP
ncbi:MAG TPA: response regulator transcription factor [Gaiellaceae bacterium]|nr:response regulator transcription factor [Gaiellaceae bacterium]